MHNLSHNRVTDPQSSRPTTNLATTDLTKLPFGATRLDLRGRILHRVEGSGYAEEPRCNQMAGENFFQEYCYGTPLADLEHIYDRGVERGELYHFVDITIGTGPTALMLTLFLYYHSITAQGWVFVEPRNAESHGDAWTLPEAA
jgi:hypothetical protein